MGDDGRVLGELLRTDGESDGKHGDLVETGELSYLLQLALISSLRVRERRYPLIVGRRRYVASLFANKGTPLRMLHDTSSLLPSLLPPQYIMLTYDTKGPRGQLGYSKSWRWLLTLPL